MYLIAFFSLILSLTPILLLVDTHIAQAQSRQRCSGGNCPVYRGSTYGSTWRPPAELLTQIRDLIAQGRATVGDYLMLAYDNAQTGQYSSAEAQYLQALELAKKNRDLDGQAAAHHGLGGVYAASGKTAEASRQLQTATEMYNIVGNQQRLRDIQQLQRVNKQLQISPQLQIPSQLQQR